jgi:hypothetical protein
MPGAPWLKYANEIRQIQEKHFKQISQRAAAGWKTAGTKKLRSPAIKAPARPCFNIINVLVAIPNICIQKDRPFHYVKKGPNSTQRAGIKITRG